MSAKAELLMAYPQPGGVFYSVGKHPGNKSLPKVEKEWVGGGGSIPGMRRAVPSKASRQRDSKPTIEARRERERQGIVRVEDYEWLVGFHAARYRWATMTGALCQDDLMQAGRMGLMRALETFEQRGLKFETYARWWVMQCIQRLCTDLGRCVSLPPNEFWTQRRVRGLRAKGMTLEAIGKDIGVSLRAVMNIEARAVHVGGNSLDKPVRFKNGDDSGLTRKDLLVSDVAPEEEIIDRDEQSDRERVVAAMLRCLTEREQDVLVSRSKGMTLEAIGDRYGISRERVRQVEQLAQQKCRKSEAGRAYQEEL